MKLTENCYCLTGLSHSDCFTVNAGFITGKKETVIIDSGFTVESARTIYGYARAAAPSNQISYVINLERHFDHIFGNRYFIDRGAQIIAHHLVKLEKKEIDDFVEAANQKIEIEGRKKNREAYIYFRGVEPFVPDIRIYENTTLGIEGLTVRIFVAPGHTETNLIAYVENEKVAYVADTLYSGYLPTLRFGDKTLWSSWLQSLGLLGDLKPSFVVPGHGEVLYGEAIIEEIERHRKTLERALRR